MMFKRILHNSYKQQFSKLVVNTSKKSSYSIQIYYSSKQSLQPFYYGKSSFQLVSSIFHQINFCTLCTARSNEVDTLRNFIFGNIHEYKDEQIEELNKILKFLLDKGYSSKDIKNCSPYLKSCEFSIAKFKELENIGSDILILLPLLHLPLSLLKLSAKQTRNDKSLIKMFPDRIAYLCHHLELSPAELIPAVSKHSALLTMKFQRLDHKMNILKSAKISSKYIVQDLWIFNYNERLLVNRIQAAVKNGMELKPWMLRCSAKFFESMLNKYAETQRILNGENVVDYLAKKLNCSTEYVEYMMERNKLLKAVNIPKLEKMLNFLFEKGYTPQEIRLFPRVFCSSVQTLNKRFEEFQRIKSTLPTISQLCISAKNFEVALKRNR